MSIDFFKRTLPKMIKTKIFIIAFMSILISCNEKKNIDKNKNARKATAHIEEIEKTNLLKSHQEAIYIKSGWIRDPYIYLANDDYYYLTGTTPKKDDPREKTEPYNTGLDPQNQELYGTPSIVGPDINVWRSRDLMDWKYMGVPFSLDKGYWKAMFPNEFQGKPKDWRLWAPEMYQIDGKWVFVHTSPAPVKNGANLAIAKNEELIGDEFLFPMENDMRSKHDPSLFLDDDGTWYLLWANTKIAPIKPDFKGLAAEPIRIDPENRVIGHEGATLRKIGKKYVHFGTAWSTDKGRKGSYNLYYCTSDNVLGPYGPRRFVGRFLGHGTPFRDREGKWWCTAFYNGNVPPVSDEGIQNKDLSETAQTINEQGTTIVPLEVTIKADGDVYIRAKDPRYANPGPDEAQEF
ncbi:MAG: family 43 glycosylhydrolase [Bacteroidota bacterium]